MECEISCNFTYIIVNKLQTEEAIRFQLQCCITLEVEQVTYLYNTVQNAMNENSLVTLICNFRETKYCKKENNYKRVNYLTYCNLKYISL